MIVKLTSNLITAMRAIHKMYVHMPSKGDLAGFGSLPTKSIMVQKLNPLAIELTLFHDIHTKTSTHDNYHIIYSLLVVAVNSI